MSNHSDHPGFHLETPSGLRVEANPNGSIRHLGQHEIFINLFPGSEMEGGPANLYLRVREGSRMESTPLLGPRSPSSFHPGRDALLYRGEWLGIGYCVRLTLSDASSAWFWQIDLENRSERAITFDLVYLQDLALSPYGAIRMNEYYVSQYLDHTPVHHPRLGFMLATRQNLEVGGGHPWTLIGSLSEAVGYATDWLQVAGLTTRFNGVLPALQGDLPARRQQHEHALAALQDAPSTLHPGESMRRGFFGCLVSDHPGATEASDWRHADPLLAGREEVWSEGEGSPPAEPGSPSLFVTAPVLQTDELTATELAHLFAGERRFEERDASGQLLSFFRGEQSHVVLKAKESCVLRPHGHILRTGSRLTPDEASLTSTVWMGGVFHSMVTQGHVSINRFLSTCRSYLGLFNAQGQRLFIEGGEGWQRLGQPSAFEMSPSRCRWLYQSGPRLIEVVSVAALETHRLSLKVAILEGPPIRLLLSSHVALNGDDGAHACPARFERIERGVFVRAVDDSDVGRRFPEGGFRLWATAETPLEAIGHDELLFADEQTHREPFISFRTAPLHRAEFVMTGHLVEADPLPDPETPDYWRGVTAGLHLSDTGSGPLSRFTEILPWFAHNALIHYLAPRGLEQYSGGGWGTRDVTQGPVELLLATGQFGPVRDLLMRLFANQNPDGDWPQWFMFFERERSIRPGDSHGDILFWPLLALAQYLLAVEEPELLDEPVPFFHSDPAQAEKTPLWGHVERALQRIEARLISGTRLVAYGHGDWNDSLQPLDPAWRERLCSSWTVTLHFQTLTTLAKALRRLGFDHRALPLERAAEEVLSDFRRYLLADRCLAGYALFGEGGGIDYLLHPSDGKSGVSYRLLPMIHALINEMLAPDEAAEHLALIRTHLLGVDGAHLFDRPLSYRGGPQRLFQRAESSSFFGREIGLMYTHAHLRYAEALWRYGDAEGFYRALLQAVPIELRAIVPAAARRQANCYYSSSDAAFADRYQASGEYGRSLAGEISLEGGWRIYSSGAGIAVSLILGRLLGFRQTRSGLIVDPVMPPALDRLTLGIDLLGYRFEVVYRIAEQGFGPVALELNQSPLPFSRQSNRYRTGGVEVALEAIRGALVPGANQLIVRLG